MLVQRFAATLARLLDAEGGRLSPPVAAAWGLVSNEAGLQSLSDAPTTQFGALEQALERNLLPPYGEPALLRNALALDAWMPVILWSLRPGAGVAADALDGRAPLVFAVLDSPALNDADDRAFAAAACRTDGAYLRIPADADVDAGALAGAWVPAAARSRLAVQVTFDPAPAPGPRRVRGTVVLDVRGVVGSGSRPPEDRLEQPMDFLLGGAP